MLIFFYLRGGILSNRFAQFVERSFQHESTGIDFLRFQRRERVRSNSKTWTFSRQTQEIVLQTVYTFDVILSSSYTCTVLLLSCWTWRFFYLFFFVPDTCSYPVPRLLCRGQPRQFVWFYNYVHNTLLWNFMKNGNVFIATEILFSSIEKLKIIYYL